MDYQTTHTDIRLYVVGYKVKISKIRTTKHMEISMYSFHEKWPVSRRAPCPWRAVDVSGTRFLTIFGRLSPEQWNEDDLNIFLYHLECLPTNNLFLRVPVMYGLPVSIFWKSIIPPGTYVLIPQARVWAKMW